MPRPVNMSPYTAKGLRRVVKDAKIEHSGSVDVVTEALARRQEVERGSRSQR